MKSYHLKAYDFAALAKAQSNKKIYQRLMILAPLKPGMPKAQISQSLFISTDQIDAWLKRFHKQGVEGLKDKARSGRPRLFHSDAPEPLAFLKKNARPYFFLCQYARRELEPACGSFCSV